MYFYYEQPIPANTLDIKPTILTAKIATGLLDFVDIGIPDRVVRLAKCKLFYNQFQLVPFNRDVWLTGNNITIRIPIQLQMQEGLADLVIYCINLDDSFQHTLSFGISVSTLEPVTLTSLASLQNLIQQQ